MRQEKSERRRTAYPLCKDLNQLQEACRSLYSLPALPLKWFASRREKDMLQMSVLKSYHVNGDLLTMMSILGLITERALTESDLRTEIPGEKTLLSDVLNNKRVEVQKLTATGILVAEFQRAGNLQECKSLIFHLLMRKSVNERLPDFFARTVQMPEFFDRELTKGELKEKIHAKDPEIDHIIMWNTFFGINVATNRKVMVMDRRWCIYYLFHSHLRVLQEFSINGKLNLETYFPFHQIRTAIRNELHIIPSGLTVDDFFSILEEVLMGKLSWEPDRELFVGSGHGGDPKRARVSISVQLPSMIKKEIIDRAADKLGVMGGR